MFLFGHGRPIQVVRFSSPRSFLKVVGFVVFVLVLFLFCRRATPDDAADSVRLRVIWGGPVDHTWTGKIYFSKSKIKSTLPLGIDPQSSCSTQIVNDQILINQDFQTRFNGIDIEITESPGDDLTFEFKTTATNQIVRRSIPVKELLRDSFQTEIDAQKNYVRVSRAAGDQWRVQFDREHMVLEPTEKFNAKIQSNRIGLPPNRRYRVEYWIKANGSGRKIWSSEQDYTTDAAGEFGELASASLLAPEAEGVYEFGIGLTEKRLGHFARKIISHRTQFVVISSNSQSNNDPTLWKKVFEIDPREKGNRFEQMIPSPFLPNHPLDLNNNKSQITNDGSKKWLQLDQGGWQVYSLNIDRVGMPHYVEIEFPADQPVLAGLSVLQIDAKGQVEPLGADSGFMISNDNMSFSKPGKTETRRMVFWPKSSNVFLLIANRHRERPCRFGKIDLYSGPTRLSPGIAASTDGDQEKPKKLLSRRQFLAFYEQPFFPENFDAAKAIDPLHQKSLTDWQFFYEGTDRLIQYLKANEYTGAMIAVASDGSSIYPSRLLRPNPKFDNGIFFSDGRDPIRKDILEMMLRMFAREDLRLVPLVEFSAPLPELESMMIQQRATESVQLKDVQSKTASWNQNGFRGANYNILSPTVQTAIKNVVAELRQRYQSKKSFGGIAIKLGPDSFTILPSSRWGYDRATVSSFLESSGLNSPASSLPDAIEQMTRGDLADQWSKWRASELTKFYSNLSSELVKNDATDRLYLVAVDLFRGSDVHSQLSPSLQWRTQYRQTILNMGIDLSQLDQQSAIVFLRPNRDAPGSELSDERVEHEMACASQKLEIDSGLQNAGDVFTSRNQWAHFSQLQQVSPFHRQSGPLLRLQPVSEVGWRNRRRFAEAMSSTDSRTFVDGGRLLNLGQEKSIANWVKVFTGLPDAAFENVKSANPLPIVVRQLFVGGRHYFYVVNKSPWSVNVTLTLGGTAKKIQSLDDRKLMLNQAANKQLISLTIEPFDIAGGYWQSTEPTGGIAAVAADVDPQIAIELQQQIGNLKKKLGQLDQVQPMNVIRLPSFEGQLNDLNHAGWRFGMGRRSDVEVDRKLAQHEKSSLKLNSAGNVVWLRSNSFASPTTGRVSIAVWLRVNDESKQPPLRIAIQGKRQDGREYYRFASVGSLAPKQQTNQIGKNWKRFAVHFDDLPPDGLTEMSVGFDLMGSGAVWIDKVQVFDRWFDGNDQRALTQILALADFQLTNKKDLESCRRILCGYWPRFLNEYVGKQQSRKATAPVVVENQGALQSPERSSSLFDRVRSRFPNRVFQIR
jgi:hypothetical protein